MRDRLFLGALLLAGMVVPLTSCSVTPALTSIAVSPSTLTATAGVTWQFTAIGTYTRPGHAPVTKDITNSVTWSSGSAQMVTVSSTGFATVTGISYGNTQISATSPGFHGIIIGTSDVTVPKPTTTAVVTKLVIKQTTLPDGALAFTAIGKTAAGKVVELTGQTKWTSSDSEVASIDAANGIVTPLGVGRTTIIAVYTNPNGTNAVGTTYFTPGSAN
jgi:Bacterial Ig-like domain (group 2)